MTKNYFEDLYRIDVSGKVEKKNNLDYLSWAWAWAELKKKHPKVKRRVYEDEDGRIYWSDGKTAWVKVSITIDDVEEIEYLPVMNYKNQAIAANQITSMNVNTAIQRAMTKAIARHGLGLSVYAGEDLPDTDEEKDRLARAADEAMKEQFQKKNEEDFLGLKEIIESCGGEEELKDVWTAKENVKIINSLKKWNKPLYDMIISCKNEMKNYFEEDQDEDNV